MPAIVNAQRDFSAGELDPQVKRRDDLPVARAGARQMRNFRVLNSGVIQQRPGRRALFPMLKNGRVDELLANGIIWRLCFGGDGSIQMVDVNGLPRFAQAPATYPWRTATIDDIVWTLVKTGLTSADIVVCFPAMKTLILSYDGLITWTAGQFSFAVGSDGIAAAPFFRMVAPGSTMTPSGPGTTGASITLSTTQATFLPAHVGALFRFANARMLITAVANNTHATATMLETMYPTQKLAVTARSGATVAPTGGFIVGQVVEGSLTAAEAIIVQVDVPGAFVYVQLLNSQAGFSTSDILVGPTAAASITAITTVSPIACPVWDEQIISDARGWPQSCNTDRQRLIFCDLPGLPDGIIWSATGSPYDLSIGANATDAMVEVIAGSPRVYHIGAWYDEIVFTNRGVFYIPIGITTPLKPGSVAFLPVGTEAPAQVKPAFTAEGFLYVNAGRNRIMMLQGTGAAFSTKPYIESDVSRYHTHLFAGSPKGIAVSTGDGPFPERYAYVINADGSVVVGRYEPGKDWLGWVPWSGAGTPNWVSALAASVIFTTLYGGTPIAEALDDTITLDGEISVTLIAVGMSPPVGPLTGPLWWLPNGSVDLMDGARPLGTHAIDNVGNIIRNQPGEDLTSLSLRAGFTYPQTYEPFVPNAEPGQDARQRQTRRRIPHVAVTVENSTGFLFASLYGGPAGPNLPLPGAVTTQRRVTAWNQDDNQAVAPPAREQTYTFRPTGRTYDPRVAVIKDTPGTLCLVEVSMEATT